MWKFFFRPPIMSKENNKPLVFLINSFIEIIFKMISMKNNSNQNIEEILPLTVLNTVAVSR